MALAIQRPAPEKPYGMKFRIATTMSGRTAPAAMMRRGGDCGGPMGGAAIGLKDE